VCTGDDTIVPEVLAEADFGLLDLNPTGPRGICRGLRMTKKDSAEPNSWTEFQNVGVDFVESSIVEQDISLL